MAIFKDYLDGAARIVEGARDLAQLVKELKPKETSAKEKAEIADQLHAAADRISLLEEENRQLKARIRALGGTT